MMVLIPNNIKRRRSLLLIGRFALMDVITTCALGRRHWCGAESVGILISTFLITRLCNDDWAVRGILARLVHRFKFINFPFYVQVVRLDNQLRRVAWIVVLRRCRRHRERINRPRKIPQKQYLIIYKKSKIEVGSVRWGWWTKIQYLCLFRERRTKNRCGKRKKRKENY